ncbi:mas-related G-protein coupled receptor member B2-like [Microtus ochrogaster]|uniref:Mas-related G-protein coupled receptor member B2-like n=1 Tax=Microtus ochrogaster TaxID=79684 RepID=A0ABM1AP96_MICOH|nr:mas-related G-protein coupled receptor member B2-like [Microtus ochrogaster]
MCSCPFILCSRSISGDFIIKDSNISTWETTITAQNGSIYTDSSQCEILSQAMIYLSLVFTLVGMPGNAIVLWILGFNMRRNAFSVYILNLAMADFLFLSFKFVHYLLYIINISSIFIKIPIFLFVVQTLSYISGLSFLSAISVERCLSVLWPIWYRCRRPRHTSAVTCALLWAISLLLSLLHGEACFLLFNNNLFLSCETLNYISDYWSIVLFVVLCGSSLILLVRIVCGTQRIPVTRLFMIIMLTVLFFLIFGLPFGIYFLLQKWFGNLNDGNMCHLFVTVFLYCVNSSANPIIYFFIGSIRHQTFQRKSLKLFLQRAMQDTPEEEGGERACSRKAEELETL